MRAVPMTLLAGLSALALTGCGGPERGAKTPVELTDVPPAAMKAAKEKLPDVTFERAMKKANGEYEVIGRTRTGKVREVDVKPDGTVTEVE